MNHAKYKGNLKRRKSSVKGLRALYLHYVYQLKRAQRHPAQKVSFRLREDVRKMDEIIAQTKLLYKYRIDTKEQLAAFMTHRKTEYEPLIKERKAISYQKRRTFDSGAIMEYQKQSEEITI